MAARPDRCVAQGVGAQGAGQRAGDSVLEASHLTKFYGSTPAIRDVNFRLPRGAILGLLGPNGSGKSTTVSILTGLLEPSGGCVRLDGVDISERLIQYKSQIGYVPEEAHLYTYLTMLIRSRLHLMLLAAYGGVAVAVIVGGSSRSL